MGRRFLATLVVVALALPAAAAGIEGTWLVEDGEAHVEIATCQAALCGRIVWLAEPHDESGGIKRDIYNPDPALRDQTVVGLTILRGFPLEPDRDGVWRGGTIYDPQDGKSYRCNMRLDDQGQLRIRGYIGVPLLGRTTRWTRAQKESLARSSQRRPKS